MFGRDDEDGDETRRDERDDGRVTTRRENATTKGSFDASEGSEDDARASFSRFDANEGSLDDARASFTPRALLHLDSIPRVGEWILLRVALAGVSNLAF